ncbi:preprotein translocase subunit SecG [Desulfocarbo indianensis]|nr:preprotein translocase subunit SecG [Desulfocarbo indianensis]
MSLVVLIIHVVACLALILVVLLQAGKGASIGAAFGGASQTVFGSAGATPFLAKLTTVVAVLFMLTSLGLAIFANQGGMPSVMQEVAPPAQTAPAPAAPDKPAAQTAPAAPADKAPAAQTAPAAPAEKAPAEGKN